MNFSGRHELDDYLQTCLPTHLLIEYHEQHEYIQWIAEFRQFLQRYHLRNLHELTKVRKTIKEAIGRTCHKL